MNTASRHICYTEVHHPPPLQRLIQLFCCMRTQMFVSWPIVKVTFLTAPADFNRVLLEDETEEWHLTADRCVLKSLYEFFYSVKLISLIDVAKIEPGYKFETCVKYNLLLSYHMYAFTKLHRDGGSCAMCHRAQWWGQRVDTALQIWHKLHAMQPAAVWGNSG